ncbi:MAG TPA: hypothetical protein VGN15_01075 [Ktedonobacteraceae bacterium]|jgi:hypothetical protein|nr:hypothetical protein [Ktedonobacteraceae bacterium]
MKKILLLSSILLFTAAPSFGQITVFDPSNLKQQVQELINMSQQLTQLQKTFALYQQQFNLLNSEAQSLKSLPTRYRYTFTNWQQFAAGNQYGNTNTWFTGITTGNANAVQTGFRNLLPAIQPVDVTATPQAQQDWRQQYGLIQLQDASLMSGIKAIGDIRTNIQQNANVLAQLEADATSTDPTMQSEKALQQKTLIALLLMIHTLEDTNRALTSSMDLQIQTVAQQRWERGRELNAAAKDRQAR